MKKKIIFQIIPLVLLCSCAVRRNDTVKKNKVDKFDSLPKIWIINERVYPAQNVLDIKFDHSKGLDTINSFRAQILYGAKRVDAVNGAFLETTDTNYFYTSVDSILIKFNLPISAKNLPLYIDESKCIGNSPLMVEKSSVLNATVAKDSIENGNRYLKITSNMIHFHFTPEERRLREIKDSIAFKKYCPNCPKNMIIR